MDEIDRNIRVRECGSFWGAAAMIWRLINVNKKEGKATAACFSVPLL